MNGARLAVVLSDKLVTVNKYMCVGQLSLV